jgi:predicted aspartyl protease
MAYQAGSPVFQSVISPKITARLAPVAEGKLAGSVNLRGADSLRYHCGCMGLFYVGCRVLNPATSKSTVVRRLMVDTGAESTWIDAAVLEAIGVEPRKKDLQFQLANGQIVTRSVGYAVLRVDKAETVDEVVFAQRGDLQLLGARALEGLNLQVDSRRKRLVAAGPIVSAAAVPPRFGQLVQVPPEAPNNPGKPRANRPKKPRATRSKAR